MNNQIKQASNVELLYFVLFNNSGEKYELALTELKTRGVIE